MAEQKGKKAKKPTGIGISITDPDKRLTHEYNDSIFYYRIPTPEERMKLLIEFHSPSEEHPGQIEADGVGVIFKALTLFVTGWDNVFNIDTGEPEIFEPFKTQFLPDELQGQLYNKFELVKITEEDDSKN